MAITTHIPRIDQPERGFYSTRLTRGGIPVAVLIWHGRPIVGGETQDRSPRWCVAIDGTACRFDEEQQARVPLDIDEIWPYVAGRRISASEYAFLRRRAKWAREHAPDHPAANPRERIDVRQLEPRF